MADPTSPEQLARRLARIEGQIRGIARMLEDGRTCDDVVTQLMAVRSGIDNVGALVLDAHIQQCLCENNAEAQLAALRDSMRIWWRFAPGAGIGFQRDASEEGGPPGSATLEGAAADGATADRARRDGASPA